MSDELFQNLQMSLCDLENDITKEMQGKIISFKFRDQKTESARRKSNSDSETSIFN